MDQQPSSPIARFVDVLGHAASGTKVAWLVEKLDAPFTSTEYGGRLTYTFPSRGVELVFEQGRLVEVKLHVQDYAGDTQERHTLDFQREPIRGLPRVPSATDVVGRFGAATTSAPDGRSLRYALPECLLEFSLDADGVAQYITVSNRTLVAHTPDEPEPLVFIGRHVRNMNYENVIFCDRDNELTFSHLFESGWNVVTSFNGRRAQAGVEKVLLREENSIEVHFSPGAANILGIPTPFRFDVDQNSDAPFLASRLIAMHEATGEFEPNSQG